MQLTDKDFNKLIAIAVGNILEWFDFAVFGAFADIIGHEFFAADSSDIQLLKSLSVFGAAFAMRPLGGVAMGWVGDTFGRKRALEISVALMLLPSFLIGCLPNYKHWGLLSTVLLVSLRLVQGLAVGGELVGAYIYTLETTHGVNKGFWGAACKATGNLGTSLGMGVAALLRWRLTHEQLYAWGWRLPFLGGILLGLLGMWLRSRIDEETDEIVGNVSSSSSTGTQEKMVRENPLVAVLKLQWRSVLAVALVVSFWGCGYYSTFVWISYYMSDPSLIGGAGVPSAWSINFAMSTLLVFWFPVAGYIGDAIGRWVGNESFGHQCAMQMGIATMILFAIPALMLICTRTVAGAICGQLIFVVSVGLFGANMPAFMVTHFPPQRRYSGVGIAYNIGHAAFSSTAALVQTALVYTSHWQPSDGEETNLTLRLQQDGRLRPAYYLMAVAAVSSFALCVLIPRCKRLEADQSNATAGDTMTSPMTLPSRESPHSVPICDQRPPSLSMADAGSMVKPLAMKEAAALDPSAPDLVEMRYANRGRKLCSAYTALTGYQLSYSKCAHQEDPEVELDYIARRLGEKPAPSTDHCRSFSL